MSNPYEPPQGNYAPMPPGPGQFTAGAERLGDVGMVRQVTVVGILNLVQAGLELIYGAFALFLGPLMSRVFESIPQQQNRPGMPQGPDPGIFQFISTIYIVIGLVLIAVAIFRILTSVLSFRYRCRGLAIASLIVGLLPIFTVYCALTAIGITIYGLIVLFNRDTKRAFDLGGQGYTKDQIFAAPRYG
ncbi:MAG: hypothetical protein MPJ50_03645 [Pirellulales bacterium]|nr:hypothetical protein [Pirellulales bacterium]